MPAGNRSALVVMNSRRRAERMKADITVFAALDHFGVAWEVLECADYMPQPPGHVGPRAVYMIAHDGAGEGLKPEAAAEIAEAVRRGAGLVSFDREIHRWPDALRALIPSYAGAQDVSSLRLPASPHFISSGHAENEEIELDAPIMATTLSPASGWLSLLSAEDQIVAACGEIGEGRAAIFGTGERLWAEDIYGHVRGVDGLMWRSIVWAARKPFPMRCVPPFVSARMDDCNGAHSAFGYVDIMNRHGIKPNLGLFIDEMGPTDWAAAKALFDEGGADFSMHAFRDDFYKASPNYTPFAELPDKPDLSKGGTETAFEGLSIDHNTGHDLDAATIRRNFERMDEAFARAGIKHSRIINAHFGEIGWRAVELFLDRGLDMPSNNSAVGQLYGNQPPWRPKPYASRGLSGRHGLVIDHCPYGSGLTHINMSVSHVGKTHMTGDILSGRVPFLNEAPRPMLPEAAAQAVTNITLGLDALAFGVLMTHEERIHSISPEDWNAVVTSAVRGLEDWDVEFTGREHVSVICKRLLDTRLIRAEMEDGVLRCDVFGGNDGPSPLTIWRDEDTWCFRRVVEVDKVDGVLEVEVDA